MGSNRLWWSGIIAIYLMVVTSATVGLWTGRRQALNSDHTEQARQAWEAWRQAAARSNAGGPVSRRPPQALEPPTTILLRDHFPTTVGVAIGLTTAIYFALALLIRGMACGPRFNPHLADRRPRP